MSPKSNASRSRATTPTAKLQAPQRAHVDSARTTAEFLDLSVTSSKTGAELHLQLLLHGKSTGLTLALAWRHVAVLLDRAERLLAASDLARTELPARQPQSVSWPPELDDYTERSSLSVAPRLINPTHGDGGFTLTFAPEFTAEPVVRLWLGEATLRSLHYQLRSHFREHAMLLPRPFFSP
jgi:hypothetical protein